MLLHGQPVGHLDRTVENASPSFAYDPDYVDRGTLALSASLPLSKDTYRPDRVAPYLRGLLPENRDTLDRWAAMLGTAPDDVFGMLAHMGWDCPGAVQFCPEDKLGELAEREADYREVDEADIARRLRHLRVQPADWVMPEEHWSLGGQQEKFALAYIHGRWHEAHGSAATTHIVKPGIHRLHNQALVEHATMRAAKALGVDVANTDYVVFEDQWAIMVERFDRETFGARVARVHQEDFCQALRRLPENKYEQRGGPTLTDMSKLVESQSADRRSDARALADFVAINVVAGAPDGHSKNISLLRGRENWVAPLYDLATGLVYDKSTVDRSVAVSVGGERYLSRIHAKQWRKAAEILKLDGDDLLGRVRHMAQQFPGAFEAALIDHAGAPGVDELLTRSNAAVAEHCARVLDRLH